VATDPTLAKLQAQQAEAVQKREEAIAQYNTQKAGALENLALQKRQMPVDIEALKRTYASGGVMNNQMNLQASLLQQKEQNAINQAQRDINTGTYVQGKENQIFSEQQSLLQQAISMRKLADQLGVADLPAGTLATAFKQGLLTQAQYEQALQANFGYGKAEADLMAQIAEKQLETAQGTIGGAEQVPSSVLTAEGVPADQKAVADQMGKKYNIDPQLLLAIALHETSFGTQGAGRQGYITGCGATDSGNLPQYAGVEASYECAAATLASKGIHTIQDLENYQQSHGRNAYDATDPGWTAGVVSSYNALVAGSVTPANTKGDSVNVAGVEISIAKGQSVSNPDQFIKTYKTDYLNALGSVKIYANANPGATLAQFVAWLKNQKEVNGNESSSQADSEIATASWNISLAWYRYVVKQYPENY
jgi:hypothetical protein